MDSAGNRFMTFSSQAGLEYVYDDWSGAILPAETPDGSPLSCRFGHFPSSKSPVAPTTKWTRDRIQTAVWLAPSIQVTLLVTERCSLRCRYCVYSGSYEFARTHSTADMPVEVALAGVDFLADLKEKRDRRNPGRVPALGFYGGEPLLRMDVIRAVVDHVERKGFRCSFNVTTNGTVDSDEVIAYLAQKDFSVAVSLDGPAEEHDRNRVFPDGRGSFERVYGFLSKLREQVLKYRGPERWPYMVLICVDKATDFTRLSEFFDGDANLFAEVAGRVTMIYPYRTRYYDGWSAEDLIRAERTAASLWPGYRDLLANGAVPGKLGFRDWVFGFSLRALLYSLSAEPNPLRGACVPGSRLAVDHRGLLHVCERVNHHYPVGSVFEGINLDAVRDVICAFEQELAERCGGCNVTRLCGVCFTHACVDGGAMRIPDAFCHETGSMARDQLGALFTVLERNPQAVSLLDPSPMELEQERIFTG